MFQYFLIFFLLFSTQKTKPDFAAAFLQPPNFDKNRPMSMNFGAVSVICKETNNFVLINDFHKATNNYLSLL